MKNSHQPKTYKSFLLLFFKKEGFCFSYNEKEKNFFFEKKKQKTFVTLVRCAT